MRVPGEASTLVNAALVNWPPYVRFFRGHFGAHQVEHVLRVLKCQFGTAIASPRTARTCLFSSRQLISVSPAVDLCPLDA